MISPVCKLVQMSFWIERFRILNCCISSDCMNYTLETIRVPNNPSQVEFANMSTYISPAFRLMILTVRVELSLHKMILVCI